MIDQERDGSIISVLKVSWYESLEADDACTLLGKWKLGCAASLASPVRHGHGTPA